MKTDIKTLKRVRKWKKNNPDKVRDYVLRCKFGISLSDYNRMFEEQNGCCAVCKRHDNDLTRRLNVDHCHETNKVRGLLCSNCNTGIGNLRDSVELLQTAIGYLNGNRNKNKEKKEA